jgi:hypothetical protein
MKKIFQLNNLYKGFYRITGIRKITGCGYLVFLLFFITVFQNIHAQQTGGIKGSIKDSATGEVIPYATVQVAGTKLGVAANVNGFYLLQNIPFGEKTIIISAIGYKRISRKINIKSEDPILLNLSLPTEAVQIQGVTRTAERLKEIYETNISVISISQEELKLIPVSVEKDLFKAILVMPGISTTGDVTSQFYVRGGSGDQNLILVDNMMVYNPFHAFGLFSIFNTDAIKVSEVFTGGFGPEFGGRLSSVINVITKEGNKNNYSAKMNFGLLSGQGLAEGPLGDGSFFLSFRKSYYNKILEKIIGKDLPLSFYDVTGKVVIPMSSEGKIIANTLFSHDQVPSSRISEPDYKWDNRSIGFNIQSFIDKYLVNVSFSSTEFKAVTDYKGYNNKKNQESNVSDFFFDAKVDANMGNNDRLSVGFSFIFPSMSYNILNNAGYYVNNKADTKEASWWIKYKLSQIDNFVAELGVRTNLTYLSDKSEYAFEPRLGLKYTLFPWLVLKSSFSRYHQMMLTTSNEDDIIPMFETWIPVSNNLPERSDEFIGGMDIIPHENWDLTLQGYYKKYSNLLSYNLNKRYDTDPDFTTGPGKAYGFEAFLKYQTDLIHGQVNYSWSWVDKRVGRVRYHPKYDRRHSINILAGTKIPVVDIDVNVHWDLSSGAPFTPIRYYFDQQKYPGLVSNTYNYESGEPYAILGSKNSFRLPWYQRLDISFARAFDIYNSLKANISFDLINVYDYKNIFYFNKETGETVYQIPFLPSLSVGITL